MFMQKVRRVLVFQLVINGSVQNHLQKKQSQMVNGQLYPLIGYLIDFLQTCVTCKLLLFSKSF